MGLPLLCYVFTYGYCLLMHLELHAIFDLEPISIYYMSVIDALLLLNSLVPGFSPTFHWLCIY